MAGTPTSRRRSRRSSRQPRRSPSRPRSIRLLQQLHAAPLVPDLLGAAIARVRDAGVITAVRVSPQNARSLTPVLVQAGIDLLVIQGTIVSAEHVARDGEPLNLKTFIAELDVPVVAGGVADHRTALHLMRTGAAGVIVGYGSTSGVTSSDEVLGISVPMATAIADAAAARREYLDETGGRYVHVLADGDIHTSGDLAKAIACGADAVVLGTPLAASARHSATGGSGPPLPHTRRCRAVRCCRSRSANARRCGRCSVVPPTTRSGRSTSSVDCAGRWPRPATAISRSSRRSS